MQKLQLKGSTEENFKKIETVLERVIRRNSSDLISFTPSSLVHTFKEAPDASGNLFKMALFSGKLRKVLFKLTSLVGKDIPEYKIIINSKNEKREFKISSKELSLIHPLDIMVNDEDFIEIYQTNIDKECVITGIFISVLIDFEQNFETRKQIILSELIGE